MYSCVDQMNQSTADDDGVLPAAFITLTDDHQYFNLSGRGFVEVCPVPEEEEPHRDPHHAVASFASLDDLCSTVIRCKVPGCCSYGYHCSLCPVDKFKPTQRAKKVKSHLVVHWRARVAIENGLYTLAEICDL